MFFQLSELILFEGRSETETLIYANEANFVNKDSL